MRMASFLRFSSSSRSFPLHRIGTQWNAAMIILRFSSYLTLTLTLTHFTVFTLSAPLRSSLPFDPRSSTISDSLRECLSSVNAEISYPGDDSYQNLTITQNSIYQKEPALFVLPENSQQASDVIKCVSSDGNVKFTPRGGGHSYTAYSTLDGYAVLDLRKMQEVSVDKEAKTAKVEAGARLGGLAKVLADQSFALPHGTCPYVGVAGHSLGYGYGYIARLAGGLMDRITEMEMITSNGTLISVNKDAEPDLFWALRGAGSNNFGTVTSFTYSLLDAPKRIVNFSYNYKTNEDCVNALIGIQNLTLAEDGFPPEFTGELNWFGKDTGDGSCSFAGQHIEASISDTDEIMTRLKDLTQGLEPSSNNNQEFDNWSDALLNIMGSFDVSDISGNRDPYYAKSLVQPQDAVYTNGSATKLMNKLASYSDLEGMGNSISFEMMGPFGYGAKENLVDASFPYRKATFMNQFYGYGFPANNDDGKQDRVYSAFQDMVDTAKDSSPSSNWGAYVNYIDEKQVDWPRAYYSDGVERLKELKLKWDPNNLFDFPQGLAHA